MDGDKRVIVFKNFILEIILIIKVVKVKIG